MVNSYFFNRLNISSLCFTGASLLLVGSALIFRVPNDKFTDKQTQLAMRSIGDELLKFNHDFSTPVPPILQNESGVLQLKFNTPITINPDSLVILSLKYLNASIAKKSIVSVRDADSEAVVYGFEIDHENRKDIPCLGKGLPKARYVVEASFDNDPKAQLLYANIPALETASASILFIFLGVSFLKRKKPLTDSSHEVEWNGIQLDVERNRINAKHERIQLTGKETQILAILFEHAGNLVSREFFFQQIWLKEGVVTDRSLDMYISRLRKESTTQRSNCKSAWERLLLKTG